MRKPLAVGISFGQLRTWHDGLGEFSLQLGRGIAAVARDWQERHGVRFHFHLPARWHGHFGDAVGYLATHDLQRWVHWQRQPFALWHSLHQHNHYRMPCRAAVRLQTVHDANFLYLKTGRKRERYLQRMRRALQHCDETITISRYVERDLREQVGHTGTCRVIYNGVRDLRGEPQEAPAGLSPTTPPYLLHISRMAPSKNVELLLQLAERCPRRQWVLAGGASDYALGIQQAVQNRGLRNVQVCLDLSDAQKAWLYAHCEAFLFPSVAEGFGLPPVEAMHFGKPVFLSRLTSLPEIGGEFATYWDVLEPEAMHDTLEAADLHPTPARREAIAAHAGRFNWPACVAGYLACYTQWLNLRESAA